MLTPYKFTIEDLGPLPVVPAALLAEHVRKLQEAFDRRIMSAIYGTAGSDTSREP